MTHLTLLCGAHPQRATRGPSVRLQAGRWKIQCAGVRDSSLILTLESSGEILSVQHDLEFTLAKSEIAWVDFRDRGKETSLTINVLKVA